MISWPQLVKKLKMEINALVEVYRDPRIPWYTRALLAVLLAYLLSPVDLIPDFIPVLGYLDDVILIPLLIFLVLKLTPGYVIEEARERARKEISAPHKDNWWAAGVIITLWSLVLIGLGGYIWHRYQPF